jgi:esterase/lipase superfamily enzyme
MVRGQASSILAEIPTVKIFGQVVLVVLLFAAYSPVSKSATNYTYDAQRPLLSLHGPARQSALVDLDAVLSALLVSDGHGVPYPVVVYIHGRGNEPRKSFADTTFASGHILEKIEEDDVRVLGFNWQSKADDVRCGRPIDKAQASGPTFAELLRRLVAHRNANPNVWRGRRVVLLVHSMGSFVLRQALIEPGAADTIRALFDVRLITESDAPARDHANWLPVGNPGRTIVLSNPEDATLAQSMRCDTTVAARTDQPRLGALAATDTTIARSQDATYIELPVGKTHRVFTRGGAKGNPLVCNVVRSLIRGSVPDMDAAWAVVGQANAVRIPAKQSVTDGCVVGAATDHGDE